jgi:hypothetical protein
VVNRATKEGLSISPQKTVVVPFTNKRKIEGLGPLTLIERQLQLRDGVKYLGAFLDSKLNWNQKLQRVIKKTQTTFAVVRHSCGIRWGLRPSMVYWLYTRVFIPSILYGVLVWCCKPMHQNISEQDPKDGLLSHYEGYEINLHCSNGGALRFDSARSTYHGGSEDGTLWAADN